MIYLNHYKTIFLNSFVKIVITITIRNSNEHVWIIIEKYIIVRKFSHYLILNLLFWKYQKRE